MHRSSHGHATIKLLGLSKQAWYKTLVRKFYHCDKIYWAISAFLEDAYETQCNYWKFNRVYLPVFEMFLISELQKMVF